MSGSNALAAAKRRRGGTDPRGPSPPGTRNGSNFPESSVPPSQINPLQLVAINHQRLNKLSDEFPKTLQALDTLGENFNALSSNCDFLHEQFTVLERQVGLLMSNQTNSNTNTVVNSSNSSNLDTSKFSILEKDVDEVHKVIARMQSFAMELSSGVSKTKEHFENYINTMNGKYDELSQKFNVIESGLNRLQDIEQQLVRANARLDEVDSLLERMSSNTQIDQDATEINEEVEEETNNVGITYKLP
jgi:chromosome segregation ATPase